MAGTTLEVVSRRTYNFNNGSATVVAAKAVPCEMWRTGCLMVRVHTEDVASSSTIVVSALPTAPTPSDPAKDFLATAVASVTIDSSTVAPVLLRDVIDPDFGGFLQINVVGTQSGGNCTAEISVLLVLKD